MNKALKYKCKRIGGRLSSLFNVQVNRRTSTEQIRGLVQRLVPHDLGVPLRRIGGQGDGGYLVPDDLDGITCCFSPGVAETAAFEADLHDLGIPSFLADYSVDAAPAGLPESDFTKKFVGAFNAEHIMTLDQWVAEKNADPSTGDMILQMDIEGAEYETILATSQQTLSRFRIIVLELHQLHHLTNRLFFRFVDAALGKLLEQFEVAHVHPNNAGGLAHVGGVDIPRLAELTFLRKDRVVKRSPLAGLPNPLDCPNLPERNELILPGYWWNTNHERNAA